MAFPSRSYTPATTYTLCSAATLPSAPVDAPGTPPAPPSPPATTYPLCSAAAVPSASVDGPGTASATSAYFSFVPTTVIPSPRQTMSAFCSSAALATSLPNASRLACGPGLLAGRGAGPPGGPVLDGRQPDLPRRRRGGFGQPGVAEHDPPVRRPPQVQFQSG